MKEKIIEFAKLAYRWGQDNGSNRSDKNFNDFLQTSSSKEIDEILALPLYEKEFVEWCLLDVGKEYVSFNSDKLHYYTIPKTEEIWFDTIDELYKYWKNLPK